MIWVYIGEVFPTSVRSKGPGRGQRQPLVHEHPHPVCVSGGRALDEPATPFVFFSAMTVVQFLVVLFTYPETKGQTLEALQRKLVPAE